MTPRQPPPSFASLEDARNHIAEKAYDPDEVYGKQ